MRNKQGEYIFYGPVCDFPLDTSFIWADILKSKYNSDNHPEGRYDIEVWTDTMRFLVWCHYISTGYGYYYIKTNSLDILKPHLFMHGFVPVNKGDARPPFPPKGY